MSIVLFAAPDRSGWISPRRRNFLLPVRVLSRSFEVSFWRGWEMLFATANLRSLGNVQSLAHPTRFQRLLDQLSRKKWVVYANCSENAVIIRLMLAIWDFAGSMLDHMFAAHDEFNFDAALELGVADGAAPARLFVSPPA